MGLHIRTREAFAMLDHLLSPGRIGGMEVRNRIAMAPMGVEIVEADGSVNERVIGYYEERARGGAGLLISENTSAAYPYGANSKHEMALSHDRCLPGLSALTERVHAHGAKIAVQLAHHGKVARLDVHEGREMLMPSLPEFHGSGDMLRDLTGEEIRIMAESMGHMGRPKIRAASAGDIEWLIDRFADAALRARNAGFDAAEFHAAHGYILSEFLSPVWNRREDEYGGSQENRARLRCEVIRAAKQRAGSDFPLWCRIDANEFRTPGGTTLELAKVTARMAAEAGADAIHVSAYADSTSGPAFTEAPLVHAEGGYIDYAKAIKAEVDVPVIAVGRIEPDVGDRLIAEGHADFIAMGRKLLADPAFPRKLMEGRREDIRPCVYCYTCVAQAFFDRTVRCAVNPVVANEHELAALERTPASASRNVVVVGGGPAGMEAARVAALRGHRVTLFEKAAQLGGTLRFASLVYEPNERLLRWLEAQMEKLPVEVRLGEEFTPALVDSLRPDVVIVAVGARRENPEVPGIDSAHVFDGDTLRALLTGEGAEEASKKLSLTGRLAVRAGRAVGVTTDPSKLREASKHYMPVGERVVVLGGGLVGAELAEFLAERGRKVTVLEESSEFAGEMAHPRRWRVLEDLRELGVALEGDTRVLEIRDDVVRTERALEGTEPELRDFPADTVIIASGLVANPSLAESLSAVGVPISVIGDGSGVGYIEGAIHDGFHAAVKL
jgi:2,4-dienoyl-CoA reductase (NADPH2)